MDIFMASNMLIHGWIRYDYYMNETHVHVIKSWNSLIFHKNVHLVKKYACPKIRMSKKYSTKKCMSKNMHFVSSVAPRHGHIRSWHWQWAFSFGTTFWMALRTWSYTKEIFLHQLQAWSFLWNPFWLQLSERSYKIWFRSVSPPRSCFANDFPNNFSFTRKVTSRAVLEKVEAMLIGILEEEITEALQITLHFAFKI